MGAKTLHRAYLESGFLERERLSYLSNAAEPSVAAPRLRSRNPSSTTSRYRSQGRLEGSGSECGTRVCAADGGSSWGGGPSESGDDSISLEPSCVIIAVGKSAMPK